MLLNAADIPDISNRLANTQWGQAVNTMMSDYTLILRSGAITRYNGGFFQRNNAGHPLVSPLQDLSGFATGGRIGSDPVVAYTGGWDGTWRANLQASNGTIVNFSGFNLTGAESNTRVPPLFANWGYNQNNPTLAQNIQNGNLLQSPVKIQWNGWTQLPSITFQSPIVPSGV